MFVPSPSCHELFDPQAYTAVPVVPLPSAHVKVSPALIAVGAHMRATGTALLLARFVPLPSWPWLLPPQHTSLLLPASTTCAQVWSSSKTVTAEFVRSAAPIELEALQLGTDPTRIALRARGPQANPVNVEGYVQVDGRLQTRPFYVGMLAPPQQGAAEPCWLVVEDRSLRRVPAGSSVVFKLFDAFNRWSFVAKGR